MGGGGWAGVVARWSVVLGRWSLVGGWFDSRRDSPPVSTPLRCGTQGTVPDVVGRWSGRGLIRGGRVRLCPLRYAPGHRGQSRTLVVGGRGWFDSKRDSPPVSTALRSGTQGTVPDVAGRWSEVEGVLIRTGTVRLCPLRCAPGHRGRSRTLVVGGRWSLVGGWFDSRRDSPPVSTSLRSGTQGTVPDVAESKRDSPPVSTPLRFGTQGTVPDVAGRWSLVAGRVAV